MPKFKERTATEKKVKVQGTKRFIDYETGEIHDMEVTEFEDRDFNFTKIWFKNFISTLELVGNKKTKLAYWIVDNLNRDNLLTMTYRQIAESANMSLDTVSSTMQILLDGDFLRRVNMGCYCVNPDIVFKGTRTSRLNVLNIYRNAEQVKMTKKEKVAAITEAIQELEGQLEKVMREPDVNVTSDGHVYEQSALPLSEEKSA